PGPEALLVRPAGQDEVALLARDRAQQLEALEAGRPVHGVLPGGEALLELGRLSGGDGETVDLHDGHRVLLVVGAWGGRCGRPMRPVSARNAPPRRTEGPGRRPALVVRRSPGGGRRPWYSGAGAAADGRGPAGSERSAHRVRVARAVHVQRRVLGGEALAERRDRRVVGEAD